MPHRRKKPLTDAPRILQHKRERAERTAEREERFFRQPEEEDDDARDERR